MSFTDAVVLASESHSEGGLNPWLVGAVVLIAFVVMLVGLFSFGKGRQHS